MADPKYANLPGIDTGSKDVYECGDLPEEDQNLVPDEMNSTSVEVVDSKGSFEKFSGKYVSSIGCDFSGRIDGSAGSGYSAAGFGLAARGDQETLFQKFNRLKIEVAALIDDVNKIKSTKSHASSAAGLTAKVEELQMQLSSADVDELTRSASDCGADIDAIIAKLGSKAERRSETVRDDGIYQLYLKSNEVEKQNLRVSRLEERLSKLEKVLGSKTDTLNSLTSHSQHSSLQDAIHMMEVKLSLLDPDKLPTVDSRLQAVLSKVNEINKAHASSGKEQSDANKKISELHEILQKWDGVRAALPLLVERLQALDALHSRSSDFIATLHHLESVQSRISVRLESASSTEKKLEETFKQNMEGIQSNIAQLNKRMSALHQK